MTNKIFVNAFSLALNTCGVEKYFDAKSLRRQDTFTKLVLKAAAQCLDMAGIDLKAEKDIALIISTGFGPVDKTCSFMDSIIDDGEECASPLAFSSSVHNAALTWISILLNIRGQALTISNLETSFESALLAAKTWLSDGTAEKVLLGAVDEEHGVIKEALKNNKDIFNDFKLQTLGHGAAVFLLSKDAPAGSLEMPVIEQTASALNPSGDAFSLVLKIRPVLNCIDMERVFADYIKTEIARTGVDIMSVFETFSAEEILSHASEPLRLKILSGFNRLLSGEDKVFTKVPEKTTHYFTDVFNKNKLINFFTSGSTGTVKDCPQDEDVIKEEALGVSFLFKDIKRVVCLVPASHSYGFIFGLQMPKILDLPVIIKPPVSALDWSSILKEGDLLVAFPMFLKQLSDSGFVFPKNITVLTSTAPCPDVLIDKLYSLGLERLIEIYGASESGAIAWRERAFDSFTLLPFWKANVNDNMLISIEREKTALKIDIPDNVEVGADGRFKPLGRKDNAVQVAGVNVFPQKVESVVKSYPPVKDCAVRKMNADEGERLKVFVVLKDGYEEKEVLSGLRAFLKERLTIHEIPRRITFGPKIPLTPFGKKKDW
jgi:4-coumarate--CoA ligase (photoactive yellow protein activation family)